MRLHSWVASARSRSAASTSDGKGLGKSGRVLCPHAHGDAVFGVQAAGFGGVQPGGIVQQLVSTLQQLLAAVGHPWGQCEPPGRLRQYLHRRGREGRRADRRNALLRPRRNAMRTKVPELKKREGKMVYLLQIQSQPVLVARCLHFVCLHPRTGLIVCSEPYVHRTIPRTQH